MSNFERSLRGGGTSTPRNNKVNNRYGPVGTGSRGPIDADELEGSPGSESSSPSVTRNTTPRQGGRYASTFNTMHGCGTGPRSTPRARSALAPSGRPPVPRQNSNMDADADAASVAESDDVSVMTEDDYGPQEGDSVQVFVRVRPINETEAADADGYTCTRLYGERSVSVDLKSRVEPYHYKFDCVLPETTTQEEVFERAGRPIVDNCMGGYNSSIFAYGQTGAGKTYTMQGPLSAAMQDDNLQRGLAPRVFQYLFQEIDKAQDENCHENLTFCCKCSMLEIYNEVITDLINPAGTNLQIREDIKRGCYVEDLSEHTIQNVSDAMALMRKGAENRHTGETRLNRESSRSHSVFTCVLERQSKNMATGITNVLFSRLNLIDLAGSERVHGGEHGGSQATGKHFKEACHINKSLTTLGRVITELVEAQRTGPARGGNSVSKGIPANRNRHVPYRDSRLTFLLQDSLGGNAKTLMIANISPCSVSGAETLSTLQFMSRAKCIRNRAKINLDAQGDVGELQREIARLNVELDNLRKGYTEPAIQEAKQLREELSKMRESRGETEIRLVNLEKENQNLKHERRRLDNKLAQVQKGSNELGGAMIQLYGRMNTYEEGTEHTLQLMKEIWEVEQQLLRAQLQEELEAAQQRSRGADELQHVVQQLQQELLHAQADAASSIQAADTSAAEAAVLRSELATEREQTASLTQEVSAAQQETAGLVAQLSDAEQQSVAMAEQLSTAQQACADLTQQLDTARQDAAATAEELAAARQHAEQLQEQVHSHEQRASQLESSLSTAQQEAAATSQQLAASQEETACLHTQLGVVQQEAACLQEQLAASQQDAADLQEQLTAEQERSAGLTTQLEDVTQQHAETVLQLKAAEQEASDVAKQLQEEREASQAQLAASTAQADALQQELQGSKDEADCLRQEGAALHQQLSQQQEDTEQIKQALSEAREQLTATQRELEQAKEMATCSEAEAGKRLADALGAAEATQQALQKEQGTNASLQEQLQALHQQLAQAKDELQEEVQARKQESDAAASSAAASDAIEQQLREQLEAMQALLATKQVDLGSTLTEKQELQSSLGLKQQQCSELQQQLEAEQGRSAEGRSQVAALEEALAELNTAVKDKSTALESAQEQIKQLQQVQQHKEDALLAAAAKQEQLSTDLSTLRESSKVKLEELMKQVTEVHVQLSASQQEQERLQEELDGLRGDNSVLQAQLADAQGETDNFRGQASSKGLEVELLRKKLSAADSSITALRTDLAEAQQEATQLRQQVQAMESDAGESQAAAEEQLNDLKRLLLDKDTVLQEYEYERGQMQRRMEELGQRLADKSSSLEGSRSEVQTLKATIRDQSAAARRQEAALADNNARLRQLQAENASLSGRLQETSEQLAEREAELRLKLNSNEVQLKEQIVYNARNRQAMNEIRKVINWAQQLPAGAVGTTPPHPSRPSSSASRRHHTQPFGHLENGSIPGSPASSHYGDLLAVEQQPYEGHEGGEDPSRTMPQPPALLLPANQLSQGSGGSNSSSSRHHSSHAHSRHHHHHHSQVEHRYGEPVVAGAGSEGFMQAGRGVSSSSGIGSRRAGSGKGGSGSPSKLAARAGDMMPLTLQVSEDLAVDHTSGHEPASAAAYPDRDTAGGAPASPVLSEAALSAACRSLGVGSRGRALRGSMGSPTRSSGSKQQLAAALAAAAAQHKLPPDQQQHHARGQERYEAAAEVEDDTLAPPGVEGSFDEQHDGDSRHLMAPQQASSPVSSPTKECPHGSISRSRTAGRDNSSRRGLRAGCSDAHTFASLSDKRHKMGLGEAHPVVLSVSGEWSVAGGGESIPDMRLPAAIVGDDGCEA